MLILWWWLLLLMRMRLGVLRLRLLLLMLLLHRRILLRWLALQLRGHHAGRGHLGLSLFLATEIWMDILLLSRGAVQGAFGVTSSNGSVIEPIRRCFLGRRDALLLMLCVVRAVRFVVLLFALASEKLDLGAQLLILFWRRAMLAFCVLVRERSSCFQLSKGEGVANWLWRV